MDRQDKHNVGAFSQQRASFHGPPREGSFRGSPPRGYDGHGREVDRGDYGDMQDIDLRKDPHSSDTYFGKGNLPNQGSNFQFSGSSNARTGNLLSRDPSPFSRFHNNSHFSARTSDAEIISSTDKTSFRRDNFVHPEERENSRSNIPPHQASNNEASRSFYAAEDVRSQEDFSEPKPDLKALLDRFDEFGGLETVLKSGLGKQHLSESLRNAIESRGSTTGLPYSRPENDNDFGYECPTPSKPLIDDRLDRSAPSPKRSFVDGRLDFRRYNIEPQPQWAEMESLRRYRRENSLPFAEESAESIEPRSFGPKQTAFEDHNFHGPDAHVSASHTSQSHNSSGIQGEENMSSNFHDRQQRACHIDEEDRGVRYTGARYTLAQSWQSRSGWQDDDDDEPLGQFKAPLCGEEDADNYELSRESERGNSNLALRNVRRTPPHSISEEVCLFVREEKKNLSLRENDKMSNEIDPPSPFDHQTGGHRDFPSYEPNYRSEFVNEGCFAPESFDHNIRSQNDVNILRSRLSASPNSNVNPDVFHSAYITDEAEETSIKSREYMYMPSTAGHERSLRCESKNNFSQMDRSNSSVNHAVGKSRQHSSSSATMRGRVDKSQHGLGRSRALRNRSPVSGVRKIGSSANPRLLERDAGRYSIRATHGVKERKRRSASLSRGVSARLQGSSPHRKIKSPLGSRNMTRRNCSRSPLRQADGTQGGSRSRSKRLRSKSPVLSSHKLLVQSRGRSPAREVQKLPTSRPRVGSAERIGNKFTKCSRKSDERLRTNTGNKSTVNSGSKGVERLHEPTARLHEKSADRLRNKSVEHSRNRSPKRLRDKSPLHAELGFHKQSGTRSPVVRSRDRQVDRRSLSPTRVSKNCLLEKRLPPRFIGFGHQLEAKNSTDQLHRTSRRSPTRSLQQRSLNSPEQDNLSLGGQTLHQLAPKSSLRSHPMRVSPNSSPTHQAGRMPAVFRSHRPPKPNRERSPARRSPARTQQRSPSRKRRTLSPVRVSSNRSLHFASERSPRRDLASRSTHTISKSIRKNNSCSSPRKSPARPRSGVLSRLSPRDEKTLISNHNNTSQSEPSRDEQRVRSPGQDSNSHKDLHTVLRSQEQKPSLQSSRTTTVFDRLATKESTSSASHTAQSKERPSASAKRSSKTSEMGNKTKNEMPIKSRSSKMNIESGFDMMGLKVIDEVSIDTANDSGNASGTRNASPKKTGSAGTKRSAPCEGKISTAEPPKKKNFVPIVFSAADFEEKPSTTSSKSEKRKLSPSADVDQRGKQSDRKDNRFRPPRISESWRHTSHGRGKFAGRVASTRVEKSTPRSSRHGAASSSHTPKNKATKEMSLDELREEIAKYDGDRGTARMTSSREELRHLLLQAKEEQVEKKLRRLNDSTTL